MDDRQLNSFTLYITLEKDAQDTLVGFPFAKAYAYDNELQYIDGEYFDDEGYPVVEVNLGYRKYTTIPQERFLNANDQVLGYKVSANVE